MTWLPRRRHGWRVPPNGCSRVVLEVRSISAGPPRDSSSGHGAGEVLAGEADGHPAVAGGGGDHLRRSGAHVPHREYAGPARFHEERLAPKRLPGLSLDE